MIDCESIYNLPDLNIHTKKFKISISPKQYFKKLEYTPILTYCLLIIGF